MADITVTAANVVNVSSPVERGVLGAAVTAGQAVYKDTADGGKAKLADTNGASVGIRTLWGIALNGGAAGQPVEVAVGPGEVNMGSTLVVGTPYVLSATPGGVAPVADLATGHFTCVLGVAKTAAILYMTTIQPGVARP